MVHNKTGKSKQATSLTKTHHPHKKSTQKYHAPPTSKPVSPSTNPAPKFFSHPAPKFQHIYYMKLLLYVNNLLLLHNLRSHWWFRIVVISRTRDSQWRHQSVGRDWIKTTHVPTPGGQWSHCSDCPISSFD